MGRFFVFTILLSLLTIQSSYCQTDSLEFQFAEANKYLGLRDSILQVKKDKLALLTDSLRDYKAQNKNHEEFRLLTNLTKQYESFVYDSAFNYASKSIQVAYRLKDQAKIAESKTNIALILLQKGLFKETIDTLTTINESVLDLDKRIHYYYVAARAYYDLGNSRWGHYQPEYHKKGYTYCQKIFKEAAPNSFEYVFAKANSALVFARNEEAIKQYQKLIDEYSNTHHEVAISNCGLGIAYTRFFENEKAKYYLLKAVVADIKSATTETVASKILAEILFYYGNLEEANKFIELAQNDATFYGSHARRLEISYIKPQIEAAVLNKVEGEKNFAIYISIIGIIVTLLIVIFLIIIYRQLRALRKARKVILDSNEDLLKVNEMLREVSKIKEEYVGYYFNFSSQFIEKMEGMKKAISRQLMTKQYDSIESELKRYNSKRERQNLFEDFDRIFLKLFPDFVNCFNQMFDEKDRIVLKDSQILNTDLRIFALIRLGVNDNEKIASILNFSVNTIYTYKTKIKNRSLIQNEDFDSKIMDIKSV